MGGFNILLQCQVMQLSVPGGQNVKRCDTLHHSTDAWVLVQTLASAHVLH